MNDTLKSSRLNLIFVSVAISIYYAAELEFTKFSFLGLEVVSGNSIALLFFTWLVWAYFLLRYTTYFFGDGGKDAVGVSIRKSIAYFLVKQHMNIHLSNLISGDSDQNWSPGKIASMEHEIIKDHDDHMEIKYSGQLSGNSSISQVGPENMATYAYEWGLSLRTKSFIRSLYRHPGILEFIAPFIIALVPATVSLWIKGPDIYTNILNYYTQ